MGLRRARDKHGPGGSQAHLAGSELYTLISYAHLCIYFLHVLYAHVYVHYALVCLCVACAMRAHAIQNRLRADVRNRAIRAIGSGRAARLPSPGTISDNLRFEASQSPQSLIFAVSTGRQQ